MFGLLIVKIYVLFLKEIHFELKNDKVLTFNIVHFRNLEISASLYLAPHLTLPKFNKRRGRLLEEIRYVYHPFFEGAILLNT